jgi:ABC-type uncharacterized transport system permease subunit
VINIEAFGMFMLRRLIINSIFVSTAVRALDLKVFDFCQCIAVNMKYHVILEDIFLMLHNWRLWPLWPTFQFF